MRGLVCLGWELFGTVRDTRFELQPTIVIGTRIAIAGSMPVVKGIIGLGVGEVTNGAAGKRTAKPKGKARNLSAPGLFDWLDLYGG
jgi:hypothetical protein